MSPERMRLLSSLERSSGGVATAATALALFAFFGKLVAFAQESAVAAIFGASRDVDLVVSGRLIPGFIGGVLGVSMGIAVIPVIQRAEQRGDLGRIRGVLQVFGLGIVVAMCCALLGCVLLGDNLFRAIAPGYSAEERHLLAEVTAVCFGLATLDTLGLLLIAVLQAYRRFRAGAVVAIVAPAVGLASIVSLGARWGMWGMIAGWCFGSVTQLLLLVWFLRGELHGEAYCRRVCWAEARATMRAGIPVVLLAVVANVVTFVDRGVASTLAPGSVALVNWAQKIYNLPIGLAIVPLATAVYPFLAGLPLAERTRLRVRLSIGATAFLLIPASLLLAVMRDEIATLLFQRGAFADADAGRLGVLLAGYGIGLVFIGGFAVLVRVSYGLGRLWEPLWAGAAGSALYPPLALLLSTQYGIAGLALAYSVAMLVSSVALGGNLLSSVAVSEGLRRELATLALAGAGMGSMMFGAERGLHILSMDGQINTVLTVLLVALVGIGSYCLLCRVLGSEIQRRLISEIRRVVPV